MILLDRPTHLNISFYPISSSFIYISKIMLYNIFVATANYFMGFLLLSTKEYQGLYLLSCYKQLENEKNV